MPTASCIFVITTLTDLKPIPTNRTRRLSHSVGYFFDKEKAFRAVEDNAGDIYEGGRYPLCVVETLSEGIYSGVRSWAWFQWDKDKRGYQKISMPPDDLAKCVSFSLG